MSAKRMVTAMQKLQFEEKYTVQHYMDWPDEVHCELINGEIFDMSPAPLIIHQKILGNLHSSITNDPGYKAKINEPSRCQVFLSPIDVVLNDFSVVQPDLIIVCDEKKLANGKYVDGSPDAAIEILSQSTAIKDRREKKILFESSGVKEYLIIDPDESYAEYFLLDKNGKYQSGKILDLDDNITFQCLPEFSVQLQLLFT
jgi:Uma2 family endonuclease